MVSRAPKARDACCGLGGRFHNANGSADVAAPVANGKMQGFRHKDSFLRGVVSQSRQNLKIIEKPAPLFLVVVVET